MPSSIFPSRHTVVRLLAVCLLALSTSGVDAQPRTTQGQIPAGQGCRDDGGCPGSGARITRTDITSEGSQSCPVSSSSVTIGYGGATIVADNQPNGGECPTSLLIRPECGESMSKPGCCILSSIGKWETRARISCVCIERSPWTLFLTCAEYACVEVGSPQYISLLPNCMMATGCNSGSPNDGCNKYVEAP